MNCPSRRATAISPAGRGIRARIPTVVPERTAGSRRSVRWYPASADDRPRTYHKTWHQDMALRHGVAGSQAGVAPGRLRQKTDRKGIPSPRPPQASRQPGVVQQSAPAKTRQPNSHTPPNPAMLVGHKESQAVCKLHSSSRSITTSCLIRINCCYYDYIGGRETAVHAVYKVLHRRGERPGILILRQISLKVAFVLQSPSPRTHPPDLGLLLLTSWRATSRVRRHGERQQLLRHQHLIPSQTKQVTFLPNT